MFKKEYDVITLGKDLYKSKVKDEKEYIDDSIVLSDQARLSNLMVLSTKNSGKTRYLIPAMVDQDLQNKEAGMTIVVGRSEIAYELYAMAMKYKRKVVLLKPSTNFAVLNQLLYAKEWDYKMINDDIINYKEAIRLKKIVIIDMETEYYSIHSMKAVDMLLMQLQSDMMDTDITGRRRHYVYIDEAYRYMDFLSNLLEYGDDYNVSTTLFFQSRSQFITEHKDYTTLINNNVRNVILLQGVSYEDAEYYNHYLNDDRDVNWLLNRAFGQFTYSILQDGTNNRKVGVGQLYLISQAEKDENHRKAISYRRKLLKELKQKVIGKKMQLFNEREALEYINHRLDRDIEHEDYLNNIIDDVVESAKEPDYAQVVINSSTKLQEDVPVSDKTVVQDPSDTKEIIESDTDKDLTDKNIDSNEELPKEDAVINNNINTDLPDINADLGFEIDLDGIEDLIDNDMPSYNDLSEPNLDLDFNDEMMQESKTEAQPIVEENKGFDLESCEFTIDGKIETNPNKVALSNRPVRVKMPYKEMRNDAITEKFSKLW